MANVLKKRMTKRRVLKESKESVKDNLVNILTSPNPEKEFGVKTSAPEAIALAIIESDDFKSTVEDIYFQSSKGSEVSEAIEMLQSNNIDIDEETIKSEIFANFIDNSSETLNYDTFAIHLADIIVENYDDLASKKKALMELAANDNLDLINDWLLEDFLDF